jgi:hypothetical protein
MTGAPGITELCWSVTLPVMLPRDPCAKQMPDKEKNMSAAAHARTVCKRSM